MDATVTIPKQLYDDVMGFLEMRNDIEAHYIGDSNHLIYALNLTAKIEGEDGNV
jgi:hypothetical protein